MHLDINCKNYESREAKTTYNFDEGMYSVANIVYLVFQKKKKNIVYLGQRSR